MPPSQTPFSTHWLAFGLPGHCSAMKRPWRRWGVSSITVLLLILASACATPFGSPPPTRMPPAPPTRTPTALPPRQQIAFPARLPDHCSIFTVWEDGSGLREVTADVLCDSLSWLSREVRWSPDGQSVAYLTGTEEEPVVKVILNVNQEISQTLTLPYDNGALKPMPEFPQWGGDSRSLFFSLHHNHYEDVYRWNLDGSAPVNLTGNLPGASYDPLASPDGEQVAFFVFPELEAREFPNCLDGCLGNLFLMEADGSNVRKVTPFDVTSQNSNLRFMECFPAWSRTGLYLAFVTGCDVNAIQSVYVFDVKGGTLNQVTATEPGASPLVNLEGWLTATDIVYSTLNPAGPGRKYWNSYVTGVNGRPTRPFFEWQDAVTPASVGDIEYLSWAADGEWVAGLVPTAILTTTEQGRKILQEEIVVENWKAHSFFLTGIRGGALHWSPEGDLLAYVAQPTGSKTSHLWVMHHDGTHVKDLTPDLEGSVFEFEWIPGLLR